MGAGNLRSTMIYLILAVAVLVLGLGVVALSRRSAARSSAPASVPTPAAKPSVERAPVESVPVDPEPVDPVQEPAVESVPAETERPSVRSRLSRARGAFAGTLLGIRGRAGITDESWDELEEALLRADVGVRVTDVRE
jgi:fused signal recognition particle receptor